MLTCPWSCVVWDLDGTLLERGSPTPVDGVEAVLAAWSEAGVEMAVATSASTALARRVVDELGWSAWFSHVAGTGPGVVGKDEVLVEALLGLGRVLPDGAVGAAMIGDAPADVAAARRHGLTAVGVTWSGTPADVLGGADLIWSSPPS
ncbi:HAD family hydrolase [Actinomycetospora termitidis]|uniref:HAD hydrolase-like protein n=1 Tax=Actinomycetospora termitidis TaxID=3053470 RepID=A0ABT7MEN0_9PSEU|nr:HAD family hydrolase [Actinomycetospora sp. Odt1-22]MDL5157828.1 HAD hydrolase-like protein [Actinomycetospora sp. Odt1-22]